MQGTKILVLVLVAFLVVVSGDGKICDCRVATIGRKYHLLFVRPCGTISLQDFNS
jgi:hypothetical protein